MTRAVSSLAEAVADRSGHRCEAVWTLAYRCRNRADAIHHRLPRARARAGDEHLLDKLGDTDNLAHLCTPCHAETHANPDRARTAWLVGPWGSLEALRSGITVDGYVVTDTGTAVGAMYVGPHPEYRDRYPTESTP